MISKLKNLFDKYGAQGTLRTLLRFAFHSAAAFRGTREGARAAVDELLREIRAGEYERLVLRRGSFGWHTVLFQRAQQLACAMGRRGCLVLYEAAPPHDALRGAEKLGEGLWLVNLRAPRLRREIEKAVAESDRPHYLMLASPEYRFPPALLRRYRSAGWGLIYDYIDAITPEISGGRRVPRRTRALAEHAMRDAESVICASSLALLRDARRRGKDAVLAENGVDCAHFSRPGPCPEDARFQELLRAGKPILCYYGALARWLDYAALRALAGAENTVFLGPKSYFELKDYAARCDVLLVPFRRGEVADAASPLKLFEYMALGKPIVAGNTAECRRFGCVLLAADARDYVRRVEQALALRGDAALIETERAQARAADWLRRAERLRAALIEREMRKKTG